MSSIGVYRGPSVSSLGISASSGAIVDDDTSSVDSDGEKRQPQRKLTKKERQMQQLREHTQAMQMEEGAAEPAEPTTTQQSNTTVNNNATGTLAIIPSSRKPPPGYINFSPRKLKLPLPHQPWGLTYEHPTLLSPSGKKLEEAPGAWMAGSFTGPIVTPQEFIQLQERKLGGGKKKQNKQQIAQEEPDQEADADEAARVDESGNAQANGQQSARAGTAGAKNPRAREAAQVDQITSKLINTVAPPAAPYTAFSEASRYHDIIHPPVSPRSLLLSKLAAPGKNTPAAPREGLPLAPNTWHITAKLPPPRPSATGGNGGVQDGFDATLAQRDARLFGGHGPRGQAPGSSDTQRIADRARRVKEKQELARKQALALQMGLLPGDPLPPTSTSHDGGPWASLHLTPRPKTSNDPRGRKEVLRMLDAFRHTPKGTQVLAMREQQREAQRDRDAAERIFRETGEMPLPPPPPPRVLQSAPSSQQAQSHGSKPSFSPRAWAKATGGRDRSDSSLGSSSRIGHTPGVWSQSARFGSGTVSPPRTSHGAHGGHNGYNSARTVPQTPSGFFPSQMDHHSRSHGASSSFHHHLSLTHRNAGGANGLPSTSSFHRVLPPAFMNVPPRTETLEIETEKQSRERLRAQARDAGKKWEFQGEIKSARNGGGSSTARSTSRTAAGGALSSRGSARSNEEEKDSTSHTAPAGSLHTAPAPPPSLPQAQELDLSATLAQIRDYSVRALACERAGRKAAEANALFCQGVLYDNIKQYSKAIECYRKFKWILCGQGKAGKVGGGVNNSQSIGLGYEPNQQNTSENSFLRTSEDTFAEALAHNSLGVSFQNLGPEFFPSALYHHSKHRDIADLPGQFIAYTNLGLIYQIMARNAANASTADAISPTHASHDQQLLSKGYTEQAAYNHQQALRCAIKMSSLAGQNIAIGNLGLTGLQHQDFETARACMERHLQLSQNLDDFRGQSAAYQTLGTIASQQGYHEEAMTYYASAHQLAHVLKDPSTADQAKVQVGVAKANAQMDAAMRFHAQQMVGGGAADTSNGFQ